MPFVLFLLGAATVGLIASQASKSKPQGIGTTYTLDRNLPPAVRDQVLAALSTTRDPTTLLAFAGSLDAAGYPLSANALRQKAVSLGVQAPSLPSPVPWPAAPSGSSDVVVPTPIPTAPPPTSPLPTAPASAQPSAPAPMIPDAPAQPPSSLPVTPTPSPTMPAAPTVPNPFSLDPNMPPSMQSAVLGALTTETDPVKLQAFAQEIQAQYPIAAGLLSAKANALKIVPAGVPASMPSLPIPSFPSIPSSPPPSPSAPPPNIAPASLSPFPIGADGTRSGRNTGRPTGYPFILLRGEATYPAKIAQQATGSQASYPAMTKLNPQFAKDGVHWINIQKGDALNIPWAWAPKLAALYQIQIDPGVQPPMTSSSPTSTAIALIQKGASHGSTTHA